jgi:hypothetical protein
LVLLSTWKKRSKLVNESTFKFNLFRAGGTKST